jgi:hypothetical protein
MVLPVAEEFASYPGANCFKVSSELEQVTGHNLGQLQKEVGVHEHISACHLDLGLSVPLSLCIQEEAILPVPSSRQAAADKTLSSKINLRANVHVL